MPDMQTTHYEFVLPEIGASSDNWGDKLNANFVEVDTRVFACATKAANLADLQDKGAARTNLGVAIGTNVQAHSATLSSLAGASANGVAIAVAADYGAMRTLLGLGAVENKSSSAIRGEISFGNVTGALGFTPANAAALSNVENKSSAVIRGEITFGNVTGALGYTPMNPAGYGAVENKSSATIRGELTAANVNGALGKTAARMNAGTDANSGLISWGTAAPGALALGEIYLRHV